MPWARPGCSGRARKRKRCHGDGTWHGRGALEKILQNPTAAFSPPVLQLCPHTQLLLGSWPCLPCWWPCPRAHPLILGCICCALPLQPRRHPTGQSPPYRMLCGGFSPIFGIGTTASSAFGLMGAAWGLSGSLVQPHRPASLWDPAPGQSCGSGLPWVGFGHPQGYPKSSPNSPRCSWPRDTRQKGNGEVTKHHSMLLAPHPNSPPHPKAGLRLGPTRISASQASPCRVGGFGQLPHKTKGFLSSFLLLPAASVTQEGKKVTERPFGGLVPGWSRPTGPWGSPEWGLPLRTLSSEPCGRSGCNLETS